MIGMLSRAQLGRVTRWVQNRFQQCSLTRAQFGRVTRWIQPENFSMTPYSIAPFKHRSLENPTPTLAQLSRVIPTLDAFLASFPGPQEQCSRTSHPLYLENHGLYPKQCPSLGKPLPLTLENDSQVPVVHLACQSSAPLGHCDVFLVGMLYGSLTTCGEVGHIIKCLKPEVVFLEVSPCELKTGPELGIKDPDIRLAYEDTLKYGATVVPGDRPMEQRAKIMLKWADLIDEHLEEIAALDAIDGGKLYHMCKAIDIPGAANTIRYYAGAADKIHGEVLKHNREFHAYTLLEPIGVVGHIIPWNFPSTMFVAKVSPSLAAGCTVVLKPAEQTPLSALFYAHLAKLAGIPDGVLNVVPGFGATAGAAISSHMDIDKVSFTGSTEVGREIMHAAARSNLKPVSLELGGKSPLVIFDDADVDKAAELALFGILFNKGEICVASSRAFVQEGIYDEFEKKLVEKAKAWVVGDPFDSKSQQGPQVNKTQFEKILSYIEHGKREGATLLTGGKRVGNKGYYIEPTIFSNVKEDMLIAQDEIFGPVLALMKFKTIDEAIKSANNTRYGLAAGIVTKSLDTANTVSRSIRAGIIWINCYFAFGNDIPYGGYKMSGFGRDFGLEALHKYLQVISVVTPIYNSPWL